MTRIGAPFEKSRPSRMHWCSSLLPSGERVAKDWVRGQLESIRNSFTASGGEPSRRDHEMAWPFFALVRGFSPWTDPKGQPGYGPNRTGLLPSLRAAKSDRYCKVNKTLK